MDYRSAPARSDRVAVVRHRPLHPAALAAFGIVFAAMPVMFLHQAVQSGRAIALTCDHGQHTCDVRRDYGLFSTHEAVPIDQVRSVSVTQHRSKSTTTYGVVFDLQGGDTLRLLRPSPLGVAESVRTRVHGMLFGDSGVETFTTQESNPGSATLLALFGILSGGLFLLFTGTARLEFQLDRGTILFTRLRWPLPPVRRTLRLADVKRARVSARPGSKGGTIYEVALVISGEDDLVLVPRQSASEARAERTVSEINAQLEQMRARL